MAWNIIFAKIDSDQEEGRMHRTKNSLVKRQHTQ